MKTKTKCAKCKREATVSVGYGALDYCDKHFLELIERRIRKDLRTSQRLSTKKAYYVKKDTSTEYLLNKYYLDRIFNKRLKVINLKKKGVESIEPRLLEQEASSYLESFIKNKDIEERINPLRTVLQAEAKQICRILGIKFKPRKANELIEMVAQKYPETKFSTMRFKKTIDGKKNEKKVKK